MPYPIVIEPYNPEWPRLYEQAKAEICGAVGQYLTAIEHIGSTSVPGLPSKPIIDVLAGVTSLDVVAVCIAPLAAIGYVYKPEYEQLIPERRYFLKSQGEIQTHHLHIFEGQDFPARHELIFRDYMRRHPEAQQQYAELKQALAARFGSNRDAYTEAKGEFIRSVVAQALSEGSES